MATARRYYCFRTFVLKGNFDAATAKALSAKIGFSNSISNRNDPGLILAIQ